MLLWIVIVVSCAAAAFFLVAPRRKRETLIDACERGDHALLQRLLIDGDVNEQRAGDGNTALTLCVERKDFVGASMILESHREVDFTRRRSDGQSAFDIVARNTVASLVRRHVENREGDDEAGRWSYLLDLINTRRSLHFHPDRIILGSIYSKSAIHSPLPSVRLFARIVDELNPELQLRVMRAVRFPEAKNRRLIRPSEHPGEVVVQSIRLFEEYRYSMGREMEISRGSHQKCPPQPSSSRLWVPWPSPSPTSSHCTFS